MIRHQAVILSRVNWRGVTDGSLEGPAFRAPRRAAAGMKKPIRSPQDAAAGLLLIVLAVAALWGGAQLSTGSLGQMGPGMLPRGLAILTGLGGIGLIVSSFVVPGTGLERWHLRGPLFVLGAAVVFGLTIRPLGLVVAAPAVVVIAALASRESRWIETLVFAVVMTALCVGLFKYLLGLPIPLAPWLIGY
jgi:putative tricarboxylic transport membrane protein